MAKTIKNIFISHIHEDDARLADLKALLAKRGYEVRDSSINSSKPNKAKDPDYIMSKILAPAINWASTMIVLVSPDTHESEWVNREIDYARLRADGDKRIVGVWDRGAKDSDLPESLDEHGNALVGWDPDAIIAAIEGEDRWVTSTGESREPRQIVRHNCSP
jgi:hypothetical protein